MTDLYAAHISCLTLRYMIQPSTTDFHTFGKRNVCIIIWARCLHPSKFAQFRGLVRKTPKTEKVSQRWSTCLAKNIEIERSYPHVDPPGPELSIVWRRKREGRISSVPLASGARSLLPIVVEIGVLSLGGAFSWHRSGGQRSREMEKRDRSTEIWGPVWLRRRRLECLSFWGHSCSGKSIWFKFLAMR
jgi:hypothetical protein